MGITYEDIKKANEAIQTTDIKGKAYAEVNQRIKAFRMVYPEGYIHTHFFRLENGICTILAEVGYYSADGAKIELGTGTAEEKEGSTFINKTSYIENAETSAVGRALGMAGFGIDVSVASAEEVQNAINNQPISKKEQTVLKNMIEAKGYKVEEIINKPLEDLTPEQYVKACQTVEKIKNK